MDTMNEAGTLLMAGGSVDITPKKILPLAGLSARTGNYTKISDPLEANAILLRNDRDQVVFLSADLLYIGRSNRERMLARLKGSLNEEQLFLSAAHNHFAPATDKSKPILGPADDEYIDFVADKMSELVEKVLREEPTPARLSYNERSNDECSVNRRRFGRIRSRVPKKRMLLLPNSEGCKDSKVRTIRVNAMDGSIRAVFWNYCCHPLGHYDLRAVSADFPGGVRSLLRDKYGQHMPVVFWQGFSGNVNPPSYSKRPKGVLGRSFVEYATFRILNGKEFGTFSESEWTEWTGSLKGSVVGSVNDPKGTDIDGAFKTKRILLPLKELGFHDSADSLVLHEVEIGKVKVIGFSAEPVAEYVQILEAAFPGSLVVPVGCIDHVSAYLPTKDMIQEGGYEVEGFKQCFELKGGFAPDFQNRVEEALHRL